MIGGSRENRFNLLLVVTGLLAIIAINSVLAVVLTRKVTDSFLLREGQVAQEFLNSLIATEAEPETLFETPGPSAALTAFATHVRSLPGTVRANIYSPDGFIRYSTDPNLVGVQFAENEELMKSFDGKLMSVLAIISGSDKAEHLALNQLSGEKLIEAYIPVQGARGETVAVVEFYRKATMVENTLDSISRTIWIAAVINGLVLSAVIVMAILLGRRRR